MLLQNDSLKFLVFAHHLSMLQACTEAVIESKVCDSVSVNAQLYLQNAYFHYAEYHFQSHDLYGYF